MAPLVITDLDGTLVNTMDQVIAFMWQVTNTALTPDDCIKYNVAKSFFPQLHTSERTACTIDFPSVAALEEFLDKNCWQSPEFFKDAKPYWALHKAYQRFICDGGTLIGCTARHSTPAMRTMTRAWLNRWGYAKTKCVFASNKVEAIEQLINESTHRAAWVVEDRPDTAQAIQDHFQGRRSDGPEVVVFLVDRPWTKGVSMPNHRNPADNNIITRLNTLRVESVG